MSANDGVFEFERIRVRQDLGKYTRLEILLANGPYNIVDRLMIEEVHKALDVAEQSQEIEEVVLRGWGDHFSAGADVREIAAFVLDERLTPYERRDRALKFAERGQNLVMRLMRFPKTTTALVHGMCFGGGFELALSCKIFIATSDAVFSLPEGTLGIIPAWGGTRTLAQRLARTKPIDEALGVAARLIKERSIVPADTARLLGIIDLELDSEKPAPDCSSLRGKPVAPGVFRLIDGFGFVHFQYWGYLNVSGHVDEDEEAFEEAAHHFAAFCEMEEAKEGIHAFLEKRTANFSKV